MNAEKIKALFEYETYSIAHKNFTSAGKFFKNVTIPSGRGPELKILDFQLRMRPIIKLPFTNDTGPINDYIYKEDTLQTVLISRQDRMKKYQYSVTKDELKINQELLESLKTENLFDKPLVFLVHSYFQSRNTPHTGIYILYGGNLYTIGFGYSIFSERYPKNIYVPEENIEKFGTFYSPDLQFDPNNPSVILWVGLLTSEILNRLQDDIKNVIYIRFFTNCVKREEDGREVDVVQNNSKYYITLINNRIYDLYAYEHDLGIDEKDKTEWNCHKWALYILFGSIDAIIGEVTDDMVVTFNKSNKGSTHYKGISDVDSDDEQYHQYESDYFNPNLMSYGICPSNLYMLYEAIYNSNPDEYTTALKQIDDGFKIRWKIRMDKQQEEEEQARQGGMNMKRKRKRNLRKTKKSRNMNKCKSKKVIVKRRNTRNCRRSIRRKHRK